MLNEIEKKGLNLEVEIWCSKKFSLIYENSKQVLQVYECETCQKKETFRGVHRFKRRDLKKDWSEENAN